jgi:hypothetical protein
MEHPAFMHRIHIWREEKEIRESWMNLIPINNSAIQRVLEIKRKEAFG